jgi:hypothetical protein
MSAALLCSSKKPNKLEDDWESCLHVLTWTALHFSKHTCSQGDSGRLLRAFDEQDETLDGVERGYLKKGLLLGLDIPLRVKFDDSPQLNQLIHELTVAFALRYEKPLTDKEVAGLQYLRDKGFGDDELQATAHPGFIREKRLASLKSPDWLVDVFRRHLDGSWPKSDKAQAQPIGSSKKRLRDQAQLELRILQAKSQKLSDGSGSHRQ